MTLSPPLSSRRAILLGAVTASLLLGCTPSGNGGSATVVAVDFDKNTVCTLDGMLLADYPGPKAQIHYADRPEPEFFCDTMEMFGIYLKPEQVRPVKALYVQDMGKAAWEEPRGAWIDAKSAWYVVGSSRHGSMGPTIASFAEEAGAKQFAGVYGGKILRFDAIKADMAALDGGALHDGKM